MSAEQFTNNATTTLGSALSSTATTLTVATGTGGLFPVLTGEQYFTATLWAAGSTTGVPNEIVKVTGRTGDTMTVVRAQEGTTATNWNVGDTFANYPTAAYLAGLANELDVQQQAGNSATDTGTANAGVVALSPVSASLAALLLSPIRVKKVASANTSTYTLNVDGHGAQAVTFNGAALSAGQLLASQIFEVAWDGTNFELLSAPVVAANTVTNAQLAQAGAGTLKGNLTGSTANVSDNTLQAVVTAMIVAGVFGVTGEIKWFSKNAVPAGYLECNGAAVSRTTYAALFSYGGTSAPYGPGDGATTFNLPDLRGEFVRGWDDARGVDPGRTFGSTQADAFQGHFHTVSPYKEEGSGFGFSGTSGLDSNTITQTGAPVTDGTSGTPRTAVETRPVNVALYPCVKY